MRHVILAWYAYSESGEAGRGLLPRPHRMAELFDQPTAAELDRPEYVAGLFGDVRELDLQVGACEWKHLFGRYGLTGLIDLAKQRGNWPDDATDTNVAEAIFQESLEAGYDPVSGLIGELKGNDGNDGARQFQPTLLPSHPVRAFERSEIAPRTELKRLSHVTSSI
ncbi:hypothetical protein [Humisphaera borealis]|uniref:Uncharacterized protein n=1 Tax=Humisphaera borealis TaxID=2807512 RepID=A0A7M2WRE0_9BACT|nr:hypothetical protein [Humisphaera borealis]QOV88097.1 hypothetical protein IPV69_17760 [Humisphaera borealis]